MCLLIRRSSLWEKHEISVSQMSIMVLAAWQPRTMEPNGGRAACVKRAVCVNFLSLIFRSCHGSLVAIPGTQIVATPTTASQTPETSPVPWLSSGSKLRIRNSLNQCCVASTVTFHIVHNERADQRPDAGTVYGSPNPSIFRTSIEEK